jgi:transposase
MEKLPRTRYSQEFRKQSVQFFKESSLKLVETAKRLSFPKETLKIGFMLTSKANLLL